MTKRMTYSQAITNAINGNLTTETIERLTALKVQLDKKAGAERKPTAKQQANETLRAELVEFINENAEGDGFTVTDILKQCPAVAEPTSPLSVSMKWRARRKPLLPFWGIS